MLFPIPILLTLVAVAAPVRAQSTPVLDWVEVELESARQRVLLERFASDVDDHFHAPDRARLFATDAEQARLSRLGFELSVLQEDLGAFYAQRAIEAAASVLDPSVPNGSLAGYRTYEEQRIAMIQLAAQFPAVVSFPFSIGTSVEGRDIWAVRLSGTPSVHDPSKPTVWFDGLHHAREVISGEACLRFAQYVGANYSTDADLRALIDQRNLLVIPCVNPDGYEFNRLLAPSGGGMWRKNMAQNLEGTLGVDLNRNYDWEWGETWPGSSGFSGDHNFRGPQAFSEPETRALRDMAAIEPPDLAVSCHSYGGSCLYPWSFDAQHTPHIDQFRSLGAAAAGPLEWDHGTPWEVLSSANGTSLDYLYGTHQTRALAFEIGTETDGFWPVGERIDELCDSLIPVFLELTRRAGPLPRLGESRWRELIGDGDEWKERGETWSLEVDLRNDGLRPVAGELELVLPQSLADFATRELEFDLAAGEVAQLGFPLRIAAGASVGKLYRPRLRLDSRWVDDERQLHLPVGEGHLLAFDSCDSADFGWSVDSQRAGNWECAPPEEVLTANGQEASQPGLDASGLLGGGCWVTGPAAGMDAEANDLDGSTQLLSPRFSAEEFEHLELRYQRWSYNGTAQGGESAGPAPSFATLLSNDDGANWVLLESLAHEPQWLESRFALEEHLELSDRMRLRFVVSSDDDARVVEALVDELALRTVSALPTLGLWGEPSNSSPAQVFVHAPESAGRPFVLRRAVATRPGLSSAGTAGTDRLRGYVVQVANGVLDGQGRAQLALPLLPDGLSPIGGSLYLQALVDPGGSQASHSSLLEVRLFD